MEWGEYENCISDIALHSLPVGRSQQMNFPYSENKPNVCLSDYLALY